MIGKISVPVKIDAIGTKNEFSTGDPNIILRVALDRKSVSFTPTEKKIYTIVVIEDGKQRKVEVDCRDVQPTPEPTPSPQPTPSGAKYDSNIQGKWANGVARFVTDREGNIGKDGFGFTVNASGKGGFRIDGKGQGNIEPTESGHRRIYVACCNYNARIEGEFTFLTGKERNTTIQGRNRHQYADEVDSSAPDSKKQGGIGFSFSIEEQKAGYKVEVVHGTGGERGDFSLPKKLEVGKLYGFKVSYKDSTSGKVNVKSELDYKDGQGFKTLFQKDISLPSQFFNKADFDSWSQFWLRLNDEGKVGYKNVRLFPI